MLLTQAVRLLGESPDGAQDSAPLLIAFYPYVQENFNSYEIVFPVISDRPLWHF